MHDPAAMHKDPGRPSQSYGPTFAAIGVVTGVDSPTKTDTVLSPELAVHTFPEASTATPTGAFREPNPVDGEMGDELERLSCDKLPDVLPLVTQAFVPAVATPTGRDKPPPLRGL